MANKPVLFAVDDDPEVLRAFEREYAEGLPRICTRGGELNQVWTNIVDNAMDAMHGKGKLKVKTSRDDGNVLVEIADDGPGISREIENRIFEPFFTTKDVCVGMGLDSTSSGASPLVTKVRSASIPFPERGVPKCDCP
jgi:signal transduction histidine kinase